MGGAGSRNNVYRDEGYVMIEQLQWLNTQFLIKTELLGNIIPLGSLRDFVGTLNRKPIKVKRSQITDAMTIPPEAALLIRADMWRDSNLITLAAMVRMDGWSLHTAEVPGGNVGRTECHTIKPYDVTEWPKTKRWTFQSVEQIKTREV